MSLSFRALVADKTAEGFSLGVRRMGEADLPAGEVLLRVTHSSLNYKDALACTPGGAVARKYPLVPGIDLAGLVLASTDPRFAPGDRVIATSYELGVSHFGGFAELARVRADWVLPLPAGLSLREAMVIGTAGLTAALALMQLQHNGLTPDKGRVLITGATGGVGSLAVDLLAGLGYSVAASTGKGAEAEYLKALGASEILTRAEASAASPRPLERERWAAVIDSVGGDTLAYALRTTRAGGAIAVCGLAGGADVATTVFPFILRGVNVLGIDSEKAAMAMRQRAWTQLGGAWKPRHLADIGFDITLDDVPTFAARILAGGVRGRAVVVHAAEAAA